MRAGGGSTVHQALTNDAANVVKQAITLARRRGHAQVTPLHVANTMLSASTGLFRTACVQSHSHPLQCRALELCFNVALNRLPASSSSPMLGGHHHSQYPSISNALVAAFKRAQAHQRRGCIENQQQQQSLLAVKIELEQLIISILDDPSVSRVMREAGFSSTQVKSNVEQAVSLEICSKHTSVKTNQDVNVKGSDPLSLSLITSSDVQSQSTSLILLDGEDDDEEDGGEEKELSCCADCSAKFKNEVQIQSLQNSNSESTSLSHHPPWFQSYKDDNKGLNDKDSASIRKLCKKWNSFCNSVHKQPYNSSERTHTLVSSISPPKQPSSSNPNSTPNSGSSSDVVEMEYVHKFKEMNAENLTTLCNALEKKVPWQKDIIPVIVSIILKCRSGMLRRRGTDTESSKEETWLFFQGVDVEAKEKIAKELARLVFGSQTKFTTIALSSFSSTRADSMEDSRNHKRLRDEQSCSYIERFAEAVSSDPHRVFLVEDVEQADYCSQMGFKRAIESGRVRIANGEEDIVSDAIVIFSSESYSSRSRACSPLRTQKFDGFDQEDKVDALDLNVCIEDDGVEEQSIENIGIYESVDGRIAFKIQEL